MVYCNRKYKYCVSLRLALIFINVYCQSKRRAENAFCFVLLNVQSRVSCTGYLFGIKLGSLLNHSSTFTRFVAVPVNDISVFKS
jgi:hypothetical protein